MAEFMWPADSRWWCLLSDIEKYLNHFGWPSLFRFYFVFSFRSTTHDCKWKKTICKQKLMLPHHAARLGIKWQTLMWERGKSSQRSAIIVPSLGIENKNTKHGKAICIPLVNRCYPFHRHDDVRNWYLFLFNPLNTYWFWLSTFERK